jgi:hypothetical protein
MELVVAITTLTILLIALALTLDKFAKFNHNQLIRQRCIAAAQAELDSIGATGKQIPDADLQRLWPKIDVSVKQLPGEGQWDGLKLVEVTATGKSYRSEVKIQLARYIYEKELSVSMVQ